MFQNFKKYLSVCFIIFLIAFFTVMLVSMKKPKTLTVASYSSFADSFGSGSELVKEFSSRYGIKVKLLDLGSGAQFRNNIKSGRVKADVIVGLDNMHLKEFSDLVDNPIMFDYGYYAFCFDTRSGITPPESLRDLEKDEYKGKIILIDPRTSDVGFGLLVWAVSVLGDYAFEWYEKVLENALTVTSSWSEGYGLFLNGEAPLVISYSTSPVYHYDRGENYIESLVFSDGSIRTEEYIAVAHHSANRENAERFVRFVLDNSRRVAEANVMYPADSSAGVSESYEKIRKPVKILENKTSDDIIEKWIKAVL